MTAPAGTASLNFLLFGAVAQLVERVVRNDEAVSSNLIGSTSRILPQEEAPSASSVSSGASRFNSSRASASGSSATFVIFLAILR